MAILDRLFGRGGSGAPSVDHGALVVRLTHGVAHWMGRSPEPELIRARLADGFRDSNLAPPTPEELDPQLTALDDEAWLRLGVMAFAFDLPDLRAALTTLATSRSPLGLLEGGFIHVARKTPLLKIELLGRSLVRAEELGRRMLSGLGAAVTGETPDESKERANRIDYERLLAEADRAKHAAQSRMEQLKKLQDERRGKF
jgi:hypothetical protein